jgi:SAM-dependent methyltransferase
MAPLKNSDPITSTTHSEAEAKMARFWNRLANFYYKQPIRDEASYLTKIEITRKYLTAQSRVLEFGCGTGGTALLHAPYVEHYHAIDVSSNMIAIAKEQQRLANEAKASDGEPTYDLQFECIGIDVLQAPPASYDVVLGLSILHLLPQKKDVLEKVHGLVKPGGYFISSTMCMKDFSGFFLRNILSFLAFLGVVPPMDPFTKSELIESIKSAGFTIEEEYHPENDKGKAVFLVARKN